MICEDGQPFPWYEGSAVYYPHVVSIGWIESEEFLTTSGQIREGFLEELTYLVANDHALGIACNQTRGIFECRFCSEREIRVSGETKDVLLGTREVWVPSTTGLVYSIPSLCLHYCDSHGYTPPIEFQDAVLDFRDQFGVWDAMSYEKNCDEWLCDAPIPSPLSVSE